MPVVTIQMTREGTGSGADHVTAEQKAAVIAGVSEVILNILGKPLDRTWVVIDEVALENWGQGGLPIAEYRKRNANPRQLGLNHGKKPENVA
jgi:4-oxalocrotonate tautomerase